MWTRHSVSLVAVKDRTAAVVVPIWTMAKCLFQRWAPRGREEPTLGRSLLGRWSFQNVLEPLLPKNRESSCMLTGTHIVNGALLETIDRDGRRYIWLAWYQGGGDEDSLAPGSPFSSDRDLNVCPSLDADHRSWTTQGQSLSLRGGCAPRSAVDALRNVDIHLRLRELGFREARVHERVGRDSERLSFSLSRSRFMHESFHGRESDCFIF